MLKRHRCSIDLGDNVLRIMGGSGVEEVRVFSGSNETVTILIYLFAMSITDPLFA